MLLDRNYLFQCKVSTQTKNADNILFDLALSDTIVGLLFNKYPIGVPHTVVGLMFFIDNVKINESNFEDRHPQPFYRISI